jgi:hypothetical protein
MMLQYQEGGIIPYLEAQVVCVGGPGEVLAAKRFLGMRKPQAMVLTVSDSASGEAPTCLVPQRRRVRRLGCELSLSLSFPMM